ncbi:MAG: universal stress protein [Desulfobacterales bacterium]|nr:universal stress protein [Desulfobacterales bacterium]MDX2512765.1 universal stress protein [Desulfobacterales bacterium]
MVEIKKILLPYDLTTNGSKIIPYVLSVAEKYNSTIYLLHVVEDLHELAPYPYPGLGNDQKTHKIAAEKTLLKKVEKMCNEVCNEHLQGCSNISKVIVAGHPIVEILKFLESEDIDLIIMGTHGRSRMEHVIFGSVAENVVKKSSVPVLTINPYTLK